MAKGQKRRCTSVDCNDAAHSLRGSSPHSFKFGARSCSGCYQRKVRCDRGVPCTNCSRSGRACVYPTVNTNEGRKTPSLQKISDRLERLESLLSCLVERGQDTTSSADHVAVSHDGESVTQIQSQSDANSNSFGATNQYTLIRGPFKSTWDLLLKDEGAPRCAKNSNCESSPQNVSRNSRNVFKFCTPSLPSSQQKYHEWTSQAKGTYQ
jgi:Fungal Zn(2)-Cys(6) binuclear cluster domain